MTLDTKPARPGAPGARPRHDPLRRRLRRRHAAHRHPVHPDRRRLRQRHQHAAGLPRRDPRAGRVAARRLRLPDQLRSSDIHTPGDEPDVLVAMNPAALKTNVGDLPAGGALIVNSDAFTQQNLNKAGYAANPLTDGSLKQYALFEIPISTLNERVARRPRHDEQAEGPDEELLRARDHVLALRAGLRGDDPLDRGEVRQAAGRRGGEHAGPQGRLRVRRDDRDLPHPLPRRAGQARRRARTATSPATRRPRSASWRRPSSPAGRCSTAPTRSRRRPTSSTSCRATRTSASRRSRPRTRSRPSAPRSARATAARWG